MYSPQRAPPDARPMSRAVGAWLQHVEPILTEVLEHVVALLPIDALLARVDVDGLVGRVEVNTIVERVDLQRIVGEVLAGIELGDLIHDSTTGVVSDVRDSVRTGAVTADGRMARDHRPDREASGASRDLFLPGYAVFGAPLRSRPGEPGPMSCEGGARADLAAPRRRHGSRGHRADPVRDPARIRDRPLHGRRRAVAPAAASTGSSPPSLSRSSRSSTWRRRGRPAGAASASRSSACGSSAATEHDSGSGERPSARSPAQHSEGFHSCGSR